MFRYILLISLIRFLYALEPSCTTCKHFVPNIKKPELGLCSMFQDKIYINKKPKLVKNLALHCRIDESLCGKPGYLYESRFENYDYIKSLCYDEFTGYNGLEELEQIERDLIDVFQKMRKHNTKRIYRTSQEIYKLFKNNKKHGNRDDVKE